ncbi:peptidoglycan editing factor PgeF [Prevotella communis]|uniref:peptidoglycan editing factor PgeF n=1 Tax=Prevotella communis TaxID=2913614 RepID=UPI001EDB91B4|nr:peptidoglycan editing factor PgeF [Prevotella communis]UKK59403.1 peptidoglycan editing factor PgeF [Prevotella communis]
MKIPSLQYYHIAEGLTAFSSMRKGGYSTGRYGEFNINRYCGDSDEAIRKNREVLCRLLDITDDRLLMPHQVHKAEIAVVDEQRDIDLEGYDALMTNVEEVCIGVSTADCIPVLLYDPRQRAVCAVHAGWRGTVMRIVEQSIARMTEVYGTSPQDLIAQIGPGIHLESFEVGDEVYQAFEDAGFPMEKISKKYEKWHLDLPECNRLQLIAAGVPDAHISVSPVCTYMQADTYFSARRLGIESGRIFTGIILRRRG